MDKYTYTHNWFLSSELRKVLFKFLDGSKENNMLEIGSFEGLSSVFLADNFLNNSKSTLTCVDPFLNISNNDHLMHFTSNTEMIFDHNISICNNSEKIIVEKITSDEFFKKNNKLFNFIYIDGCHDFDFIRRDIINSFNVLVKDGIMWMDDYRGFDGIKVKNVMDNVLEQYTGQFDIIHKGYQLAIKKK